MADRMEGTPTYTRHTVAWPNLPMRERTVDEVSVSFDADGGGTNGEFRFVWLSFSGHSGPFLRVEVFTDGLGALLDPRIMAVLPKLKRESGEACPTPDEVIALLEAEGVIPSLHHLRGRVNYERLTPEQRSEIGRLLLEAKAREGG